MERLTRQTEQALLGIETKLVAAVTECKNSAVGEITTLRGQLQTWSVGAKAEINEITAALNSGKGLEVQFRHWVNVVDIRLEAIHGWTHAGHILNRIKRSDDPIDSGVLESCLTEACDDIDKAEDVDSQGLSPRSIPFSKRRSSFMHAS